MTNTNIPLDVLVVGGGMYVAGRGVSGADGTIMPALLEGRRAGKIGRIAVSTTRAETAAATAAQAQTLAEKMGVDGDCFSYPASGVNEQAFLAAVDEFKPEAVIVSVPDHLHADVSVPLIEQGLPCLVVKPMAGSLEDAKSMAVAADKAGVIAQVEFHKRLDESNRLLRDAIRGGQIGDPLYAVVEYSQRKIIPSEVFKSWAEHSNIFQYLGVHYVDLIQWMTDYSPVRVTAWGQKRFLAGLGIDTWDSMQVVIEWDTGDGGRFVSTHITNWIDPNNTSAMSDQKINVVGTKGRFQADQKNRGVQVVTDDQGVQDVNPYFTASWKDDLSGNRVFEGYGIKSVLRFVDDVLAVRAGNVTIAELEGSRPGFRACVVSTAVVEAARQSLENNSNPVEVSL